MCSTAGNRGYVLCDMCSITRNWRVCVVKWGICVLLLALGSMCVLLLAIGDMCC